MADPRWQSIRPFIRATIGGQRFNGVVQWATNWELNNIPYGMLMLSVGRRVDTLKAAEIHEAITKFRMELPVTVELGIQRLSGSPGGDSWPDGYFTVFDGSTGGTGWDRSRDGAMFTVNVVHWLSDLNSSSSISATSHPLNPMDYTYGGVFLGRSLTSEGGLDPQFVPMTAAQRDATPDSIREDLWGNLLQPWMVQVAEDDLVNVTLPFVLRKSKNDSALKALRRIAPLSSKPPGWVASTLDDRGTGMADLSRSIATYLAQSSYETWANTTLWGKLIGEWCPEFFLGLVPRISDAIVIPLVAGLKSPFDVPILGSDYSMSRLGSSTPSFMRAIGILASIRSFDGGLLSDQPSLAGRFESPTINNGMIMYRQAPRWLSDLVQVWNYSGATTGTASNVPIGNAFSPDIGPDPNYTTPANLVTKTQQIMAAYAQSLYINEVLKNRMGELSGKLRFDIAPGTTVRIEAAGDLALGEQDLLATDFYAMVLRVSCAINAQMKRMGTAFTVAQIRTKAENDSADGTTSIDKPPFYAEGFKGCRLIDIQQGGRGGFDPERDEE